MALNCHYQGGFGLSLNFSGPDALICKLEVTISVVLQGPGGGNVLGGQQDAGIPDSGRCTERSMGSELCGLSELEGVTFSFGSSLVALVRLHSY